MSAKLEDRTQVARRAAHASCVALDAATERLHDALEHSSGIPIRELDAEDSLVIALEAVRTERETRPPPIAKTPRARTAR